MLSITAQWLLARRRVESWLLWIIVGLIAVPLFASRGLYATSAVYVVLLGLSIDGLIQWRRAAAAGRVAPWRQIWRRKHRQVDARPAARAAARRRSAEHTSELQSLMRISYDVFFLQKQK